MTAIVHHRDAPGGSLVTFIQMISGLQRVTHIGSKSFRQCGKFHPDASELSSSAARSAEDDLSRCRDVLRTPGHDAIEPVDVLGQRAEGAG